MIIIDLFIFLVFILFQETSDARMLLKVRKYARWCFLGLLGPSLEGGVLS